MTTEEQNNEILKKLTELQASIQHPSQKPLPIISTSKVYASFKSTHTLHVASLKIYDYNINRFIAKFPTFPTSETPIEEYINNLTLDNGNPASLETKKTTFREIHTIIKYAVQKFELPDYLNKLIPPTTKEEQPERISWTEEQMKFILYNLHSEYHERIFLTVMESDCRIGELGITPEHDCPRVKDITINIDSQGNDRSKIAVWGKSGYHLKNCKAPLAELLIQNAHPITKALFHTKRSPNGVNSISLGHTIETAIFQLLSKYPDQFPQSKFGAHTIRHSIATMIAIHTENPMLIQEFLSHKDYRMSQKYVHLAQNNKRIMPSPLQMLGIEISKHKPDIPQQQLLISDVTTPSQDTELVIYNPNESPIEKVEATIDIAEQLFPDFPQFKKDPRPNITQPIGKALETALRFYQRNAPINDPYSGTLSRWYKGIINRKDVRLNSTSNN